MPGFADKVLGPTRGDRNADHETGLPLRSTSFSGQTPVHFEGHPGGPFEGVGKWVGLKDFEHATLCRALQLDQTLFWFDLPSSVRGVGSNALGAGGNRGPGKRRLEGFVFMGRRDRPVATLYIVTDADELRDMNVHDVRDYESFRWRR